MYPNQQSTQMPGYTQKQQGFPQANMSHAPKVFAAFSMGDMEKMRQPKRERRRNNQYISEFAFQNPYGRRKKKSLLGSAVKYAGAAATGAALLRYGGAGLKAGMKKAQATSSIGKMGAVRRAGKIAKAGVKGAAKKVGKDLSRIPGANQVNQAAQKVGAVAGDMYNKHKRKRNNAPVGALPPSSRPTF